MLYLSPKRPAEAADRTIPGHWGGDLIQGSKNSSFVILVERRFRFVMLTIITDNKNKIVISALIKQARELPIELYIALTWDRGAEMTSHARFTVATDIQIYLCDPQSPWQRDSNENTNRLLRQYFPNELTCLLTASKDLQCCHSANLKAEKNARL